MMWEYQQGNNRQKMKGQVRTRLTDGNKRLIHPPPEHTERTKTNEKFLNYTLVALSNILFTLD